MKGSVLKMTGMSAFQKRAPASHVLPKALEEPLNCMRAQMRCELRPAAS